MSSNTIPVLTTRDEIALKLVVGMLSRPGGINPLNVVNTAYDVADVLIARIKQDRTDGH